MAKKPTPPFVQPSTSELLSQGFRLNAPIEEDPAEVKAPTTRTWGETATDTGRAILGGVGGLISGAGTVAGMLPGGNMDNGVVQFADSTRKYWEDGQSAVLKQKKEDRSKAIDAADGQWGKAGTAFWETVSDPALLLDTAASNVTTLIPGTVAGRLGAAAKMARGMRAGPLSVAGSEALANAAGTLGTRISIGTGAVQQGADVSGELYKSAMKKTNDEWMQNPEFMAQLAQTDGSDQAIHDLKSQYAQSASRAAFLPAAGVSVFANKFMPGGDMVERALVGGAARNTIAAGAKYAVPKAMAKASIGEAAQEFVEEGGGKRVANAAMQSYVDPGQDSWEGVGENAGMGAAGGFGMGMVGGAFHREQGATSQSSNTAAQAAAAQAAAQQAAQQAAALAATQAAAAQQAAALAATQAAAQQPGAVASRAAVAGNAAQIGYTPPTHTVFANGTIVPASNTTPGEQAVFDQRFIPQPTGDITDVEDVSQARATTPTPAAPIATPAAQPIEQAAPIEQVTAPIPEAPLTRAPDIATGPARVLQNRDRSTAASIGQMNDIASAPDYLRAGQSRVMDSGAPVVFGAAPSSALMGKQQQIADGHGARVPVQYAVVEAADVLPSHQADGTPITQYQQGVPGQLRAVAGNGRAAGITEAYRRGTTAQYRQDLIDDAPDLGVDPEAISAMSAPMLVRVMPEEHVTDDIGDRSNISGTAALSATEQAANDTKRLDMSALSFDEVGMPDQQSIAQFVNAMPVGERGAMMQPDGSPTRQLVDRITSAAFKSAYGNDELVTLQAQSTDPEIRTIITALANVAGPMAGLEGAGDLDIRGAVSEAAQMAVNAKRLGIPLADYLNNADMGFSGEAFVVAKFMADNIRSAKRMAEGLRAWVNYVAEQVAIARDNQAQDGFFGATPTASRNDVFNQLGATNEQANTSTTPLQNGASGPSRVTNSPQRQDAKPVAEPSRPADFEEELAQTQVTQPQGVPSGPQADETQPQQTQSEAHANSVASSAGEVAQPEIRAAEGLRAWLKELDAKQKQWDQLQTRADSLDSPAVKRAQAALDDGAIDAAEFESVIASAEKEQRDLALQRLLKDAGRLLVGDVSNEVRRAYHQNMKAAITDAVQAGVPEEDISNAMSSSRYALKNVQDLVKSEPKPLDQAKKTPEKQAEASKDIAKADAGESKANLDERNGKAVRDKAWGLGIDLKDAGGKFKVLPVLLAEIKAKEEQAAQYVDKPKAKPVAEQVPEFKSLEEFKAWSENRSAELAKSGNKQRFTSTDEYRAAYESIEGLLQEEKNNQAKAKADDDAATLSKMTQAGFKLGDRVVGNVPGPFLSTFQVQGVIYLSDGTPSVKLDSPVNVGTKLLKSMKWDERFSEQGAPVAAVEPAGPSESDNQLKALINAAYVKALNGKPFSDGLVKTSEKLYRALIDRDAKSLADILNPSNKVSRSAFEIIMPQVKLATSISGVKAFCDDLIGNMKNASQVAAKPEPVKSEPKPTGDERKQYIREGMTKGLNKEDAAQIEAIEAVKNALGKPADGFLQTPTPEEVVAQQDQAEAAAKAEAAQRRAQDEHDRLERERKDIAKASQAAADTFELGGDAEQNLSGQGDIFGKAPTTLEAAKPQADTKRTNPTPITIPANEFVAGNLSDYRGSAHESKDHNYVNVDESAAKDVSGFASENSAIIAWKQLGKPVGAVLVPFRFSDGSYSGKYADAKTRYSLFIPRTKAAPQEQQKPAPKPVEASPKPSTQAAEKPQVKANTIFTEDAAAAARARLKAKLGRLNSGIDPEMLMDGITLAGYHIEQGARTFAAYAKAMVGDLGDGVKPYLKSWYMAISFDPRASSFSADMTPVGEVATLDLEELNEPSSGQTLSQNLLAAIESGNMPKDNPALKKLVEAFDGKPAYQYRMKQAQEQLEMAIVMTARKVVAKNEGDQSTYGALLRLYESQPNLNIRTSTSIANQAYSTPAPLAYLASKLTGITQSTVVLEPTGGTGMLLIAANPNKAVVNEFNDLRVSLLEEQGFKPTQKDAATESLASKGGPVDAVITNPPFGSVKDANGKPVKIKVDGYDIGQIDHLIAARALETMKDDGRATLIIGANKVAGGMSTDDRIFFNWLYSHYNVDGHFEVNGDLYTRQGAGWPVRVISISGRQKSSKFSPLAGTIQRANNWEQVYEQYNTILDSRGKSNAGPSADVGNPGVSKAESIDLRNEADGQAPAVNRPRPAGGGDGNGNVTRAPAGVVSDSPKPAVAVMGTKPSEQRRDERTPESSGLDSAGVTAKPAGAKPAGIAGTTSVDGTNEFQSTYIPRSARKDEGVLIPANMAQPTQDALDRLEDEVGNIDEFAHIELGYESVADMHAALMGLQVDSVAMSIWQIKRGKAVVIADQTGIGKGRQAASIIRWSVKQGMTPVFISVKPSLFTDMYGDLADIGTNDVNPFILNGDAWVSGEDGTKLFSNKPATHKSNLQRIASSGELPSGSNALFMTYSQINTDNIQRQVLTSLAPNAVFILDESHNAAGASATGEFMISALTASRGVTYLSATYAKRPDNMPLYFKTDIGDAAADAQGLSAAMSAGGLPLQTVVSNNLVKAGQMFRRERSYDGISIVSSFDTPNRALHERMSNEATKALRAIVSADRMFHAIFVKNLNKELQKEGASIKDGAGNQASAGVQHTEFSSVVHNFVKQMLLGLKAQTAADEAIASFKRGEKPIIAVENTMGSFLNEYAASNGIAQGESLGSFDYRTVLSRALARTRVIIEKAATGDETKRPVSLSELDIETSAAYRAAQEVIDGLSLSIPVSPIDWIRAEVARAGFSIAEITGRNLAVDYSEPSKPVLSAIDSSEQTDKVGTTRLFNSGKLDALVLNVAGSTGISLHSSERFEDQRQRHMIVVQAAGDINIFMQMLGRVHRTGQVNLPKYTILSVDLPTEKRPTAVLSVKMKSLNANTSSNTESATSVKTADILNKYGDQIVAQYLMDNLQLARDLDMVDLITGDGVTEDIARKATGRLALQPIEVQHTFYDEVEAQYVGLIEYLDKTNQNDLVPRTFDFDAKELRQEILFDGPNKSTPFGEDAIYGEYSIKAQGEPMKPHEIQGAINENLGGLSPEAHIEKMLSIADKQFALLQGKLTDEKQRESALAVSTLGRQFMVSHPIGSVFRVDINSDQFNAVVLNVRSAHKETGNPFSLSKIQLTVAVNGSLRSLAIPATQFKKIEISSIAPSYKIEQLFKEQPPNQRETAKIVTGNLLAAYGEIEGARGTIISFTKQDGTSEQGILLPKAFDYSKNTRGDYRLQSGAEALKFLQNSLHEDIGRFGIMSRDGIIRVLPNWKGVSIRVPKSKLKGGKVFLDAGLIAAGGDFVSYGGQMAQNVDNPSDAIKVLDLLMKKQALYALPSMAEEAKGMADAAPSSTPKFSRSLPDVSDPRTGISTALLELGQDANLFQYPRSDALYLEHIAEDKSVIGDDGKPRTIEVLPVDRSTDDPAQWMLANTTPKDDDATDTRSWMLKTPTGKWATLTKTKGTVYINVSGIGEGGRGSAIYDLAANFALNNGLVFVGDPNGVSPAAMRRRLENMLSSAIKYGTTDHLQPHPDQYLGDASIGVPELDWKKGDTLGNIRSMIDVSIGANAFSNPFATALIHYDPATQSFVDDGGNRLDARGLSEVLGFDGGVRHAGQGGDTTLRRHALFQSLLQSVGNRTGFVAQLHSERNRGGTGVGSALEKTFYSRGSAPGKLGVALVQASANSLTQHWANAPEVVVLSSMDDARVPQAVRDEDARQRSQGASGSPEGFVHEGVVYLVADQLATAADVKRVLMHETLGHVGLRGVFGRGLNQVLNQVAMGRRADVSAKAAQYGLDMNDPAQRLDAAEEMLAEMAQANPQLGFVKRAISAIRNWLRAHGFNRLKLTDADIVQAYILPARGWVERGSNAGSNGSSLFSRGIQSLRDISGWTDLPDFQSNNESTVLFNGGNGPYIDVVKDNSRGLWPGLFSSENVESAHGPGMGDIITAFRVSNDKMLENFDGIDEELVKNELMQLLPNRVKKQVLDNEDALETLITAVVEDNHDRVSDEFNEIFGLDYAEGSWEAQSLRGQLATRLGYDAVAMDDEHGTSWYIRPGIKSIPLPNKSGNLPAFSRSTIVGDTNRYRSPEVLAAMRRTGMQVEVPTLQERAKALWADAGKKLTQGIVDQFSPVKELSQDAYRLLRMSKGASGAFEALMHGGRLKLTDGVYDIDRTQRGGVVEKLFKPMQGEHHDFLRWVAANRAERLLGDGREHLFTQQDIDALKTLADGTLNHAYTLKNGARAGQTTTDRREMYQDSLVTFNEFNTNALDMAEQSGLINADGRKDWESEFYVPFYRAMQEDGSGVVGGNIKSGVVRQSAFKHLKGGTDKLNADLLDNTLMNWAHLLDAGAKNRAALATLEAAQGMGVAIEASADVARDIGKATHNRNGVVWAMDEGVQRYFVVDDPYILTALTSLEYAGMRNPVMNAMGTMKRLLTIGVTASPFFKVRNLIRDSVQAIGLGDMSYNIGANLKEGWKLTDPKSDAYFSLLASGGTIHFGSMYEGNESKRIQALVESGVDRDTILNDPYHVKNFYRKAIEPGLTWYNELGNRGEAINRAALYDHLVKKGVSHAEAALQARDLMDFSMQGAFTSIRFLTQVVPFMNARLQGLYKLGKSAKQNPQRFTAVLGAVAAVSLYLLAAYGDDDDWKRRDESDRNNFWWFKVGGKAYRIPKPFEIGAIATLAERGFELAFDKEMTRKRFRGQVLKLLGDNLSMNPTPQLIKPMLDVYANLDSFTGRPIESMGMERLKAEYRYNDRTSMTARGLSTAMNSATGLLGKETLSPVEIDHMLRGYFGWLGSLAVGIVDLMARPATGQVDQASRDLWKTATGNIASDLRDAPSRYVSQMYEQAKEIERAYGTWRELQKTGKTQEAQEFRAEHLDELRQYHRIEAIKKRASQLNQQSRIVERSATMPPEQKRERLRALSDQRNALAKSLV